MNKLRNNLGLLTNGMMAMLSCIMLFSCDSEDILENNIQQQMNSDYICFGISSDNTRSISDKEENECISNDIVLRTKESKDTLCVSTYVSEGIYSPDTTLAQNATRAIPVTKDNFYDSFHVLAYWKKDNNLVSQFYMDEQIFKSAGSPLWRSNNIYYWLEKNHSLQFLAWAPDNAPGLTRPATPNSMTLGYTVPANVADQKDITIASTLELSGNYNQVVPMDFKHVFTAVRFEIGNLMQKGTIKSVALKNVKSKGTLDAKNLTWTLTNDTQTFSQTINLATTGNETSGSITTPEGTFMMLPQVLHANAEIEVVFQDNVTGTERVMSAPIANREWKRATTVTYKIAISPDYELQFVNQPEIQDAHYVIYPITIKANRIPKGSWTLTSNDNANVTFVESGKFAAPEIQGLVDDGYWLKDNCGTPSLTSTSQGDVKVYVFLKENATDKDRDIVLSIAPTNVPKATPATFKFKQYCPAWNNGLGVERIQEKDYPWGFNWDESSKITFDMPRGLWGVVVHGLWILFGDRTYVTSNGQSAWRGKWKLNFDLSKIKLTVGSDPTDGLTNTWNIYNFDGVNEADAVIKNIQSWGGTTTTTLPANPVEFAAKACAKKNPHTTLIKENQQTGGVAKYYSAVITTENKADMVWYLPAQNESTSMKENSMSGDYWTSTAILSPGTTAYKYSYGAGTSPWDRNSVIHVRATRKHP